MASIIVVNGKSRGNYLPLRAGTVTLGRDEDCDLQVQGEAVSRRHLMIRGQKSSNRFVAIDAGSANGVFINGRRIERETLLSDHDVIVIGESKLLFTVEDFLDREGALNFFQRGEEGKSTVVR